MPSASRKLLARTYSHKSGEALLKNVKTPRNAWCYVHNNAFECVRSPL